MIVSMKTGSFEEALAALGVTCDTLTDEERTRLDELGFLILPGVVDSPWLEQMRSAFEQLATQDRQEGRRQGGTRHVEALQYRSRDFDRIMIYPKLLAAAYHILQAPFRCNGLDGRDPLGGHGLQGLHSDSWARSPDQPFHIINSLWLLDNFISENGATRIVPGSHTCTGRLPRAAADPNQAYPGEVIVTAPAGSALIFNGHLLHGGTRNQSGLSRRVVRCGFEPREARGSFGAESSSVPDGIPTAARFLFE